jgi:hypothetical protein
MARIQLISLLFSLFFLGFIARLVLRRRLREEYAFVWIAFSMAMLFFAAWRDSLEYLARLAGIFYAPSLLFLVLIVAILALCVHLSVAASRSREQVKHLVQRIALTQASTGPDMPQANS